MGSHKGKRSPLVLVLVYTTNSDIHDCGEEVNFIANSRAVSVLIVNFLLKGSFVFNNKHIKNRIRKKSKNTQKSSSFLDSAFKSQKWYETYRYIRESIDTQIQVK